MECLEVASVVGDEGSLLSDSDGQLCVVFQAQGLGLVGAQHIKSTLPQVANDTH